MGVWSLDWSLYAYCVLLLYFLSWLHGFIFIVYKSKGSHMHISFLQYIFWIFKKIWYSTHEYTRHYDHIINTLYSKVSQRIYIFGQYMRNLHARSSLASLLEITPTVLFATHWYTPSWDISVSFFKCRKERIWSLPPLISIPDKPGFVSERKSPLNFHLIWAVSGVTWQWSTALPWCLMNSDCGCWSNRGAIIVSESINNK